MGYIFEPQVLHSIAKRALGLPHQRMVEVVVDGLMERYPGHITRQKEWMFNNAGGLAARELLTRGKV